MDQSPPFVLRSVSLSDVTTETINLQPQNYAVVSGQAYRIRRIHEEKAFLGMAYPSLEMPETTTGASLEASNNNNNNNSNMSHTLQKLKQSEDMIRQQKLQIDYQNDRIQQLETLLRKLQLDETIIQRPFLFPGENHYYHHHHTNNNNTSYNSSHNSFTDLAISNGNHHISPVITSMSSALTLTREKSGATSDETDICSTDTPVSTFHSVDSITPKAFSVFKEEKEEEESLRVDATARKTVPKHKISSQSFFPSSVDNSPCADIADNVSILTNTTFKDEDEQTLLDDVPPSSKTMASTIHLPISEASPDRESLQQRLSMSATERRKIMSNVCSSRSKFSLKTKGKRIITNNRRAIAPSGEEKARDVSLLDEDENMIGTKTPIFKDFDVDRSSLSVISSPRALTTPTPPPIVPNTKCFWKSQQKETGAVFLFIAYDNPQLHKSIQLFLESSTSSSSRSMHIMIETHENKEKAKFLFGQICFSGFFSELEGFPGNISENHLRGSNCLVVQDLIGVSGDIKSFTRRNKADHPDIIELHFINRAILGNTKNVSQEPQQYHEIKKDEDVIQFFQGCTSRVDVILDPYHDSHSWYPYYEGSRKMAPQFRSKGIGYLRLGDDMSNYGTAFLSIDAGKTFLDHGASNIVNTNPQTAVISNRKRGVSIDNCSDTSSVTTIASTKTVPRRTNAKKGLTNTIRKIVTTSRENSLDGPIER